MSKNIDSKMVNNAIKNAKKHLMKSLFIAATSITVSGCSGNNEIAYEEPSLSMETSISETEQQQEEVAKEEPVEDYTIEGMPSARVKKHDFFIAFAQYSDVKVHSLPDKSSDVIAYLPVNQEVAKTGDVEFIYGTEVSANDSSGDHSWAEIMYQQDGEAKVGFVYADYIGEEKSDSTKEAFEAPSYTAEQKEDFKVLAKKYRVTVPDDASDEEIYEMKLEVSSRITGRNITAKFNKMASDLAAKMSAEFFEEQEANERERIAAIEAESIRKNAEYTQFMATHTYSFTAQDYVDKGYDHSATNSLREQAEAERRANNAAYAAARGGIVNRTQEYGVFPVNGINYTIKYTTYFANGEIYYQYTQYEFPDWDDY